MRAQRLVALIVVLLLVALATAPIAAAKANGTDRPIRGTMSGEMNFVPTPTDPACPMWTVPDGGGTVSHLGLVWSHWWHCMPTHADGHFVITAANGDQLWGEYTVPQIPFRCYITGGTGRFEGATGWFDWDVKFWGEVAHGMPINPWHFKGYLDGVISY
jgi:hypothetical protein